VSTVHDPSSDAFAQPSGQDVLSDVLRSVRLTGSMLFLVDAGAPFLSWAPHANAIRRATMPAAQHLISYHIVTQGHCWGGIREEPPQSLEPGDVLVVPHGDPYYLADPADAAASYGEDEAMSFFRAMAAGTMPSTLSEGSDAATRTRFICGFLGCDLRPFNPVLATLPRLLRVRTAATPFDRLRHLVAFALSELRGPSSGSRDVLLRLAELMFVEVVRHHLESMPAAEATWLAGLKDPLVARALAHLHGDPARQWSLVELAARSGTSRSVLAERFAHFVGQPPMQYLTRWRLQLAARLLDEPHAKVGAVAAAVGYKSEAAFSRAFKKGTGVPPAKWRLRAMG
jgi:AraC-like DNA-binding protein